DCTNPAPQNEGNPCEGEEKEAKESDCYRNKLCPKDCGPGFWGEDCKFLCQNCEPDCEKFTGQCSNCKAGYKRPKERCNVGCEENEYGPNCLNNCTHKCGEDCADRIHGFCAKNILLYAPLMLILFLTPYVLLFCLRSRDRKIQKEEGEQKSKLVAIHETKSGSSEDSD
ncbi:cell death abnormality protein 1, partial [Biomphalaria glabrata]